MCGRYKLETPLTRIVDPMDLDPAMVADWMSLHPKVARPRYNIAPTQDIAAVVRANGGARRLRALRWGLVPHWATEPDSGARTINARSETAHKKPAYRAPFAGLGEATAPGGLPERGRCVIPADAFYEWKAPPPGVKAPKKPMLARLADGTAFVMLGLYDTWSPPGARSDRDALATGTVLTCEANPLLAETHPRMPVMLPLDARDAIDAWLDPATPVDDARALLVPLHAERMDTHEVSARVGSVANDDPALAERVDTGPSTLFG